MTMPRVKICGITSTEDGLCAAAAGADALGFVFYHKSPRHIEAEQVRDIVAALPPFVTTVGLFVNMVPAEVDRTMRRSGLQVVQLHGDETPQYCRELKDWPLIKALRVRDESSLQGAEDYPVQALLVDAWSDDNYGGTGHLFDWQLLRDLNRHVPLILAGGLKPDNVADAVTQVQPYAVDVSSGVEAAPGRKDARLVKQFIQQVKNR